MEEMLEKLKELLSSLQQSVSYYAGLAKEVATHKEKLDTFDGELVVRTNEVVAREDKVKNIEDVATLSKQAIKDRKEADSLLKTLKEEQDKFDKLTSEGNEVLGKERAKIAVDRIKADNELKMIQKEWQGLKKEQETWKEKFFKELQNRVK